MKIKHLKTIVYIACGLLLIQGMPAYAQLHEVSLNTKVITAQKKVDLKYDIYAGGFKALDAEMEMDVDKKAYDISLNAKTRGFIGGLFPWQANYSTSGHTDKNGKPLPMQHLSTSQWKEKVKTTEMDYDPKGKLLKTTNKDGDKITVDRDVKKEMSANAVDMLTGTLMMMQNAQNKNKCAGSFPVYDGKRRYNITLHDDGTEMMKKSSYSSFEGLALRCTLKVEPVAGFKEKDKNRGWMAVQNHTEARKKPPTIWLARLSEKSPTVPVRMEIASEYGSVVAHLTSTSLK